MKTQSKSRNRPNRFQWLVFHDDSITRFESFLHSFDSQDGYSYFNGCLKIFPGPPTRHKVDQEGEIL